VPGDRGALVTPGGLREHSIWIPFRHSLNGVEGREGLLLEGPAGWGEISILAGYPCEPRAAREAALEAAQQGWPAPLRQRIPVNAMIPAVSPERAGQLGLAAHQAGYDCVKVKVGSGDDIGRVKAVRDAVGPRCLLRLDANGAWELEEATARVAALARFDLELVEQPVATLEDLARLRRRVDVPLAADESVRGLDDARRLARLEAADMVMVKVQPLGGVRKALEVVEAAGVAGVVSSMLETSVGLAAGLALAACLPELQYACGLATAGLLAADVTSDPLVPHGGVLQVRPVTPDPVLVGRLGRLGRLAGGRAVGRPAGPGRYL